MRKSQLSGKELSGRVFLMLQGPQSRFFVRLARELMQTGARVVKVNLCGGDVLLWHPSRDSNIRTLNYHGRACSFPLFVKKVLLQYRVTDLLVYGDWRPLHQDAILLARSRGVRIWVFEEGYLREGFVTLERNGVNGRSSMPKSADTIRELARDLPEFRPSPYNIENIRPKVLFAIRHHVGNVLLFFMFMFYRTHRVHNIFFELIGILPRYLRRVRRNARARQTLENFFRQGHPYFFYPLQLNHDSQIQLYSPYIRQEEAITTVISSFAQYAPPDVYLVIKNHPLDNGLIPYRSYISAMARALNVDRRVVFVEAGNNQDLISGCRGVVLINSTMGLSALCELKNVFCLGYAIYSVRGLARNFIHSSLDEFWKLDENKDKIDPGLLEDFCRVLRSMALLEGDYYTKRGTVMAVNQSIVRFAGAT